MNSIDIHLGLALFAGMDRGSVEHFLSLGHERRLAEKETLFVEDDPASSLFIIEEGTLAVRKRLSGGSRGPILHRLGPGTVIGEIPFFDRRERSGTITALTETKVLEISYEAVERYLEENPADGARLLRNMGTILARRFRLLDEEIRDQVVWGMESSGAFPAVK
jgi:CRP-like cAMP-binding protein